MGARSICCQYNLAKLDPVTGSIIWQRLIRGDASTRLPQITRVEPLRGTNDIIVGVASASSSTYSTISRVDTSVGAQVWNYAGSSSLPKPYPFGATARYFGSQSAAYATISTMTGNSGSGGTGFAGLDYNGNFLWANSLSSILTLLISPTGTQVHYSPGIHLGLYDNRVGTLINTAPLTTVTSLGLAVDQSTGYCLVTRYGTTVSTQTTVNPSASYAYGPRETSPPGLTTSRWVGSTISQTATSDRLLQVNYASTGSIIELWRLFTAFGVTAVNNDCAHDASGAYFGGNPRGTNNINIYKRENVYGSIVWGQDVLFTRIASTSIVNAVAVADDGYVYVGGSPT